MNTQSLLRMDTKIMRRRWLRFCLPLALAYAGFCAQSRAETTAYSGGTQITTLPMTITTSGTYYLARRAPASTSTSPV